MESREINVESYQSHTGGNRTESLQYSLSTALQHRTPTTNKDERLPERIEEETPIDAVHKSHVFAAVLSSVNISTN